MYQVSDIYKRNILKNNRNFESKIAIGNNVITNEQLIALNINGAIQQDDTFSIGNTISSTLNLTFLPNDIDILDTDKIDVKIGLLVNEQYEYIPMGIFNIDQIDETDTLTTIIAYDNMIKFDIDYIENNENPTVQSIINRLVELTGVQFGSTLSDYTNYNLDVLTGYSCRVVLGFIAALFGCNAIIDRQGKFKFVSIGSKAVNEVNIENLYTKDSKQLITRTSESITVKINNNYNSDVYFSYTKKNKNYKLTRITNETDVEELSVGNDEGMCLYMNNPLLNQTLLTDLYNKLKNTEYAPFNMNWQGDLAVDLGDKIAVVDTKGVVREHPVLGINFNYNGGLNSTLTAQGETSITNTYKPPTTQQEQEIIATKKKVVKIEKDAGELYVVVYDNENNSSVRLTEKLLEAIANEIVLQADNIKLEGLTTINDKFKILTDGTMQAKDGTFEGAINGGNINIGNTSQDGKTKAFVVSSNGNLRIGGLTGYTYSDGSTQGIFEVTSKGKLYSRNATDALIYTILDNGVIEVRNGNFRFRVNTDGIQVKNFEETGGILTLTDKEIQADMLTVSGKIIANGGLRSNSYVRGASLAINNKKFKGESSTVYGSNQSRLFIGDTLIIYGRTNFTGLTANTTKTNAITFDKVGFVNPPVVMTTVNSSTPDECRLGVGSITATGFNLYLNKTNSLDTKVFWVAIGERGGSDTFVD